MPALSISRRFPRRPSDMFRRAAPALLLMCLICLAARGDAPEAAETPAPHPSVVPSPAPSPAAEEKPKKTRAKKAAAEPTAEEKPKKSRTKKKTAKDDEA